MASFTAENADGTVLFNFEPNLGKQQLSNGLTVLSTGQQQHTHLKLSKVAEGSDNNQLTYRLWDSTASPEATSASVSNNQRFSYSSDAGTLNVDRATSQPSEEQLSEQQPSKQQARTRDRSNGSTDGTLSLLLDLQPSSDRREQADIPEYSFAATQGSPTGPSDSPQRPPLMQKPVRPPVVGQPPSAPHTESRFEKKEERWVPCYLWHESGLPKTADLREFPYEFYDNSEISEDPVTSSDAPAPLVDSDSQVRQHQAQSQHLSLLSHHLLCQAIPFANSDVVCQPAKMPAVLLCTQTTCSMDRREV